VIQNSDNQEEWKDDIHIA